nr:EOG090X03KG [Scapholeberis mucronata]
MLHANRLFSVSLLVYSLSSGVLGLDYTDKVFEGKPYGLLAAFGDFNSDKLTDVFVVENHQHSFGVLLAYPEPPFLRREHLECHFDEEFIVGLIPGDFDGDGAMDVLVVSQAKKGHHTFSIHVAWGSLTKLECPNHEKPLLHTMGHPLVLDYNGDMISDLFALDPDGLRTFWIFNSSRQIDHQFVMHSNNTLRLPHSHAYVDVDGDMSTDLFLTGETSFEVWHLNGSGDATLTQRIPLPVQDAAIIGQSIFVDVNFDGKLEHLVPVCVDYKCQNSSFYLYTDNEWGLVPCNLKDPSGKTWTFQKLDPTSFYQNTLTARSGDFNLDGYPDLLVTLCHEDQVRAVLLENTADPGKIGRQFVPRWDVLSEWNTTSVMATMYDIQEKGILDVLLVHRSPSSNGQLEMAAYKNTLDYDANFIKVLVLTGRCYTNCSHGRIPYGTNLPGPSISYRTTHPNGEYQLACSSQLSQSAYNALQLPYTLFGLARSPNFLEVLSVSLNYNPTSASREWTQIIPNSQMIIIPTLDPSSRHWLNKLFVTPSRAIVLSAAALGGFGFLLAIVVTVLHARERRADKLEQLAEMVAAVNRKDPFQFDSKIIAAPTQVNSIQNADSNRATINRDIDFHEIHDIFLDRTLSPARTTDEPLVSAFRQVAWSPIGLIPYRKCILATVTADHRVTLYRKGTWVWEEVDDISPRWYQHIKENNLVSQTRDDTGHSTVFSTHKAKCYLLGTMSLAWSPLYSGKTEWAWLITLQRSGHIVIWKAQASFTKVEFSVFHDLKLADPSVLKLHSYATGNQLLLFAGSYRGLLNCWILSWNEEEAPSCKLLGSILPDEDQLSVNAIEVGFSNDHFIVSAAKSNAIVTAAVKYDGNELRCTDVKYTLLPGLQLSGLTQLADGTLICVTEDYIANEIKLTVNNEGKLQEPIVAKLEIPTNPTMLCRGITTSCVGDPKTLFALESVKLSYDHLKCRQPTSFTIYVGSDLQKVTGILERAESMNNSLLTLETYKALNVANWESIWEMDPSNMNAEDNYYLQLLRWLALYKCNVCFIERRYDKEMQDDLKSRAEKAAFYLQIRHVEKQLTEFSNRSDNLTIDELLIVSLACQFINSLNEADLSATFDRSVVDKVQKKFPIKKLKIKETCPICQETIPFEDRTEGTCRNQHKAKRCPASLQACFTNTFSCRWCGNHFHLKSGNNLIQVSCRSLLLIRLKLTGIELCILCGGGLA